jgi:pimeloyl-ACP methyl ester carboxylesterase
MLILITVIGAAYAGACAWLYFGQRNMIYFPPPYTVRSAANTDTLRVADAELKLTVRPSSGPNALVYFGGNAEDVAANLPEFAGAFPEHALYLLHYRGYGGSSGSPSEEALHADALALFDKVHESHANVVVVGRSLGSSVAIRLASERPVAGLALVTPFDSIAAIAAQHYPWVPVNWLFLDKYESWRHAPRVSAPTLVLVAEHDRIIPRDSTDRLMAVFPPGVASRRLITGTDHNSISVSPQYLTALKGLQRPH